MPSVCLGFRRRSNWTNTQRPGPCKPAPAARYPWGPTPDFNPTALSSTWTDGSLTPNNGLRRTGKYLLETTIKVRNVVEPGIVRDFSNRSVGTVANEAELVACVVEAAHADKGIDRGAKYAEVAL